MPKALKTHNPTTAIKRPISKSSVSLKTPQMGYFFYESNKQWFMFCQVQRQGLLNLFQHVIVTCLGDHKFCALDAIFSTQTFRFTHPLPMMHFRLSLFLSLVSVLFWTGMRRKINRKFQSYWSPRPTLDSMLSHMVRLPFQNLYTECCGLFSETGEGFKGKIKGFYCMNQWTVQDHKRSSDINQSQHKL